ACPSAVRHELVVGGISREGALASSSLASQLLRPLLPTAQFDVRLRPIPFQPADGVDGARLEWEFNETRGFQGRQLKKDPRLKPEDIQPSFSHLTVCTSCEQRRTLARVLHNRSRMELTRSWELLVDDYPVESWKNVVRFLNAPRRQQVVMRPSDGAREARFGCPCSVWQAQHNQSFKLYHSSGQMAGSAYRYTEWPREMRVSSSTDGIAWGESEPLTFDGGTKGMTGTFTAVVQDNNKGDFLSGYEGANSKACLARSTDGRSWKTIPTGKNFKAGTESRTMQWTGRNRRGEVDLRTPLHLTRSKFNLRANRAAVSACGEGIHICKRNGTGWGHGAMMVCLVGLLEAEEIRNADCVQILRAWTGVRRIDCTDGSSSRLGRAADAYVQPLLNGERELVWYRRDYGGPGGWREIRGVQVVEVNKSIKDGLNDLTQDPLRSVGGYYLDRLGKLERFRRQIYTLSFTRRSKNLWLGLMTVIEWAKDLTEIAGENNPAFTRDTTNVYLVTSRDGVHIDDEWVYAQQPLLTKGKVQKDWNSGFLLPAAQMIADAHGKETRVYYEARRVRHEERFNEAAVIGLASWQYDQLVGIRVADPTYPAFVLTKAFRTKGKRLALILNVGVPEGCHGRILVRVLPQGSATPLTVEGGVNLALNESAFDPSRSGNTVRVTWYSDSADSSAAKHSIIVTSGTHIHLNFSLYGHARLYGFRPVWLSRTHGQYSD
ncbi:MAG: hypothetical protein SGPRY_012950, partial [Prymnesium sp.]